MEAVEAVAGQVQVQGEQARGCTGAAPVEIHVQIPPQRDSEKVSIKK